MNPEQLLAQAQDAIRRGADPAAVNERIAKLTRGAYENVQALAVHAAQSRLNERGGSALGDFARMAAQGATFGFADELAGVGAALVPGGKGYSEARDASRQRVEDLRMLAPGASAISEIAGGVAVPASFGGARAGMQAARGVPQMGIPTARAVVSQPTRQLMRRGALAGAGGGGLYGLGEGEGLEGRLMSAGVGAGLGAAAGGVLPHAVRSIPQAVRGTSDVVRGVGRAMLPGGRPTGTGLARAARKAATPEGGATSGGLFQIRGKDGAIRGAIPLDDAMGASNPSKLLTEAGELLPAKDAAKAATRRVSRESFGPLEKKFAEVADDEILAALQQPNIAKAAKKILSKANREFVETGGASGTPPSFTQLQSIRKRLQGLLGRAKKQGDSYLVEVYGEAKDALTDVMYRRLPGFADAQKSYASAKAGESAFDIGWKAWGGQGGRRLRPEVMERQLAELPTDAARQNYKTGMLARLYDELARKGSVTKRTIDRLESEGMRGRIRQLFWTDADYEKFTRELRRNGVALVTRDMLKPMAKGAAAALGIGGAAKGLGLFD